MYSQYGQPDNKRRPIGAVELSSPSEPKRFAGGSIGSLVPPPPPPGVSAWSSFSSSGDQVKTEPSSTGGSGGKAENPFDTLLCYDGVGGAYVCPFGCKNFVDTASDLKSHAEQKHGVKFPHICVKCGAGFQYNESLIIHSKACGISEKAQRKPEAVTVTVPVPVRTPVLRNGGRSCPPATIGCEDWWLCGVCGQVHFDAQSFRFHFANAHPMTCIVCQIDVMDGSPDVCQHAVYAHPTLVAGSADVEAVVLTLSTCPPYCNICLADFSSWTDVAVHRGTNVTTGQPLCTFAEVSKKRAEAAQTNTECHLCKLPTVEGGGVRQHFETCHARTCCVCWVRFWTQAEYDAHMYGHNEWLNSAFSGKDGFWQELQSGTKPHCKHCLPKRDLPSAFDEDFPCKDQTYEEDQAAIEQQGFTCWPEVEQHYRDDHARRLEPPHHTEDLYMFAPP